MRRAESSFTPTLAQCECGAALRACYIPCLSWHPFDDLRAGFFTCVMPQPLHLRCKVVAVLTPKRLVPHLSLWRSGHAPPPAASRPALLPPVCTIYLATTRRATGRGSFCRILVRARSGVVVPGVAAAFPLRSPDPFVNTEDLPGHAVEDARVVLVADRHRLDAALHQFAAPLARAFLTPPHPRHKDGEHSEASHHPLQHLGSLRERHRHLFGIPAHLPTAVRYHLFTQHRRRRILRSSQKITHTSAGGRNARGGAKKLPG